MKSNISPPALTPLKLIFILTLLLSPAAFSAEVVQQQIDKLQPILEKGSLSKLKSAAKQIAYSGISSPALFDRAETRLMSGYRKTSKDDVQMTGWLIKVLSYSGNEKYKRTLSKISSSVAPKKVRGYAKSGLETLESFAQWNPEIIQHLDGLTKEQADEQRIKNMLSSSNYELVRIGAKRVYYAFNQNQILLKMAEDKLLADFQKNANDNIAVDTMAWLCKALSASGDTQYLATLKKVENRTSNRKLKKYARKYAGAL